jgi:hypothetical protein
MFYFLLFVCICSVRNASAATAIAEAPIPQPPMDGGKERKVYGQHIERIVDAIAQLTLVDVADLNRALKVCLCVSDCIFFVSFTGTTKFARCIAVNDAYWYEYATSCMLLYFIIISICIYLFRRVLPLLALLLMKRHQLQK